MILCADIEKAFLQTSIKEKERERVLEVSLDWESNKQHNSDSTFQQTGIWVKSVTIYPRTNPANIFWKVWKHVLRTNFERYESMYLELIRKIRDDMYVNDLVTGRENLQEVEKMKSHSIELFEKEGFKLHKWHSNEPNIETNDLSSQIELNFEKKHLRSKANETKIPGLNWDKQRDTFRVEIPTENQPLTKRNVLKTLASIYHPLGFISPVILIGKILFRNLCDLSIPWDNENITSRCRK